MYNSAMAVGLSAGTGIATFLAARYDWRTPCVVLGLLSLAFAAMALTLPKENAVPSGKANGNAASIKEGAQIILKNKSLLLVSASAGGINLIIMTMISWMPVYMVRELAWPAHTVGTVLTALYLFVGIGVAPLSGLISDRLGRWDNRTRVWFGMPSCLLSVAFTLWGLLEQNFWLVAAGMIFCNLQTAGFHVATQELVPSRYRASAYGTYVLVIQGLGFLGPIIAGALSDMYGLVPSLLYMQVGLVACALGSLVAGFTYRGDLAKSQSIAS